MKIGFVIGTYGTPSYVELGIRKLLSFGIEPEDILVIDDASGNEKLRSFAKNWEWDSSLTKRILGIFPVIFMCFRELWIGDL